MLTLLITPLLLLLLMAGGSPAYAQTAVLQQQIQPILCVYTTTDSGAATTFTSSCKDEPLPMIVSISVDGGRPIISGSFDASAIQSFRIWIGGQWYTLKSDPRFSSNGNDWTLDLSTLASPLPPGTYDIALEALDGHGFLLQETDAASFTVTAGIIMQTPGIGLPELGKPEIGAPSERPSIERAQVPISTEAPYVTPLGTPDGSVGAVPDRGTMEAAGGGSGFVRTVVAAALIAAPVIGLSAIARQFILKRR